MLLTIIAVLTLVVIWQGFYIVKLKIDIQDLYNTKLFKGAEMVRIEPGKTAVFMIKKEKKEE